MTDKTPAPIDCTLTAATWDAELMSETYLRIAHWERPSYFTRLVYDPENNKVLVFYYGNYLGTLHNPQQVWDLIKAGYSEAHLAAWRAAQAKRFGINRPRTENTKLPPELERISKAREENARWRREQKAKAKEGKTITLDDLDIKI